MTIISNRKLLEIETVGSQDRPINKEDRKSFSYYFKKRKDQQLKQGRAIAKRSESNIVLK